MQPRLKIGVLYSRVRVEEKWIFGAMEKRGIDYDRLDDRAIHFDLNDPVTWQQYDAVLERSISYNSGLYALRLLNAFGVPTVNTASVAEICGDKLMTSAVLARDGVPQPHNATAFTPEAALEAIEAFGYPVVLNRWLDRGDDCSRKSTTATRQRQCLSISRRWGPCSTRCFTFRNISRSPDVISGRL